jgi:DNA polymerase I-like protein with 3'-5' exonuclease and polymerase domains
MTWTYITSREQLNIAITNVLQSPLQWVGCDTETTGLDCHTNKVRLVQFDVEDNSYILDTWLVPTWTESFQRLIDCKTLKWAFHNFKFDLKFFWANKLDFFGCKVFDTMIASALISAGLDLPNDLAHVAERYVGIEVDKTEQKSDWSVEKLTNSQLYYASKDARTTRLLGAKLVRIIYSDNLTEVFKLEMRALYSFAAMEWYGMQLDTDRLELLRPIYENNLLEAEKQFLELVPVRYERHNLLGELIDTGFKLSSSDQVLEVLRGYEIPNPLYNPDSNLEAESDPIINSTGANVVKLLDIVDYPILEALLAHRKAAKLLSAYVYSLPKLVNSVTGRVHTNYRQMVSTGRVSSSNPNLQNLSRPDGNELNLRSCFVPAPGFELVDADFSQIELRVIAEIIYSISGDDTMLQEFIAGKDPYAATAAMMASIDYSTMVYVDPDTGETKVKKEFKTLRQNAKAVRLGYNYAMGYKKFRNYAKTTYGVSMTIDEAQASRNLYFAAYPGLNVYHNQFKDKNLKTVHSLPPFSRPRHFDEYPGIPALANHPVQSTSADIQKLAQAILYESLYKLGYSPTQSSDMRMISTIHDELVSECLPHLSEQLKVLQQYSMESAAKTIIKGCPVIAEANVIANLAQKG